MKKIIEKKYPNIAGIIVSKNEKVLYEDYFNGMKETDSIHIASVTKSILSLLIGIAIKNGHIGGVDDLIIDYFPDYKIKKGERKLQEVRLKDLLRMSVPLKVNYEPYTKVYSSEDWTKSVLDLIGGRKEFSGFRYTTVCLHVLSSLLVKATGKSVKEFAQKELFNPLKIDVKNDIVLESREDHINFMKNQSDSGWVMDPKGVHTAGWGLTLTANDMLKIGELYMNLGEFKGRQIVSSDWIKESIKVHNKWDERGYGLLWWIIDSKKSIYAAIGDSGNIIYIDQENKFVVAINSLFMPRADNRLEFIKNEIRSRFLD
jgi:CubicO group peptidase (beta-lactamase class C family)